MNVVMVGSGYVGLVSGTCFAEFGANVTCVDVNRERIESLRNGELPIYEPGLEELVSRNVAAGTLAFSTELGDAVGQADVVFIAVGTPSRHGDGYADLSYVYAAAREIASSLNGYTVIVDKSTVPVGTARQVERIIQEVNQDADFDVASNPEFLREGAAIGDFMNPDRVVVGVESDRAEAVLRHLYRPLAENNIPILATGLESAELIKYASNAFLATKLSFINEIANLCEAVGANVKDISRGMGLDGRIASDFLNAGPGYGGSCFPKDTTALIRMGQEYGAPMRIVEAAVEVNAAQKARMITKIRRSLGGSISGKDIAILGLAFKPDTDDIRDSPALTIIPMLHEKGARIRAHDPEATREAKQLLPEAVEFPDDIYEMVKGADAVVLMTEWVAYCDLDLERIRTLMAGNVFVDLRNVYTPELMARHGLSYCCVGFDDNAMERQASSRLEGEKGGADAGKVLADCLLSA